MNDSGSQAEIRRRLEFDAQETFEARCARALDVLHPMLMSWGANSSGHPRTDLRPARVLERKHEFLEEFPMLWQIAQVVGRSADDRGSLNADEHDQGTDR